MSEAKLHILKQRLLAGKRAKAARGELGMRVPMGYTRRASGEVIKEPDEHAQTTVELIFEQFERLGTINGVLRYLIEHRLHLPHRLAEGLNKGELTWRRPTRQTLRNVLRNPIYAGAYVYGRRPTDPKRQQPGRPATGKTVAAPTQWPVVLKDRLPAYISWERFEYNLKQLELNRTAALGVARAGPSLLSGLVICGRCGLRMSATYTSSGHRLRYSCYRAAVEYGEAFCQSLVGQPLDECVSALVLQALEPAALEISLKAAEDLEAERCQLHQHWQQRLERARYEAERAARQYQAVEPENRLVARTLEKHWEQALAKAAALEAEYQRFQAKQPPVLTAEERAAIRRLAGDIPALWRAPTTTSLDRQAIIRQMVERVIVTVQGESEQVDVQLHWLGGQGTQTQLIRPVARLEQLSYYPALVARVVQLHQQGLNGPAIAAVLNDEGWRPAKRCQRFNSTMVIALLHRQGLRSAPRAPAIYVRRRANERTLQELSCTLDIPQPTLYSWLQKGQLKARQVMSCSHPLWLITANEKELKRLQALRTAPRSWRRPQ